MALIEASLAGRFMPRTDVSEKVLVRSVPERVVLDVVGAVAPTSKPPVCIFLGTEPAQYRAERVFFWSIEQVRDRSRVYEIFLMKDLAGFDRRRWLTGFTNYRFAIPHFAGSCGRAIYNDVDQVYLSDPAQLFDTDMDGHGFLSVNDSDTSVMLMDCARMSRVWTLEAAQHKRRKSLEARARAIGGLWGQLDPAWNARDTEYVPRRSKLLHYTTIHMQPWQPFPRRYVYQRNPVAHVWLDMEHAANEARYQVFTSDHPSARYQALVAQLRAANAKSPQSVSAHQPNWNPGLNAVSSFLETTKKCTVLDYALGKTYQEYTSPEDVSSGTTHTVARYDLGSPEFADRPTEQFDLVICTGVLEYLPDEDVPWVLQELFAYARQFIYVLLTDHAKARVLPTGAELQSFSRKPDWWLAHFEAAGTHRDDVHWRLDIQSRTVTGRAVTYKYEGGRRLAGIPTVWVLTDHKPGHTTQSIGLAEALGWPYEVKELRFNPLNYLSNHLLGASWISVNTRRSAPLTAPWPDLVIATGRRTAPVARWIRKQSRGRTRLVQLGRKGGNVAEWFDLVVNCAHFRLPLHAQRIETVAPLHSISRDRLSQAAEKWRDLFGAAPRPHVVLLVGGSTARHRLDPQTAKRLGEEVRTFTEDAGGTVFAITSRRTGSQAVAALKASLGRSDHVHEWRPGQQDNPYLAYLALADVIVVTGESESMLAEAAATDSPVYIYPLPERPSHLGIRLKEWMIAQAYTPRWKKKKGTVRPQQGLQYSCARLIERGFIQPPRDLNAFHQNLLRLGVARLFGETPQIWQRLPLQEVDEVARKVRSMLGVTDPRPTQGMS